MTLAGISRSITFMDLSYCKVVEVKDMYYLDRIETLKLQNNNIQDLHNEVLIMLETMKSLTDLDLRNNPVGKGNSKYRDHIIMTS
jgi:Leucine-rich repeat (LRR) protein